MKKIVSVVALAVFLTSTLDMLFSSQAEAQTYDHLLRGLTQIKLLIESLNEDSSTCGLTQDLIRGAVRYPASSAKFEIITDTRHSVTLYVNVRSAFLKSESYCFSNISVEVYSLQRLTLDFSHREAFAKVDLWDDGGILGTNRAGHAHHSAQFIEDLIKKFVTDWNLDNKDEK
jgi:hypothetical protein